MAGLFSIGFFSLVLAGALVFIIAALRAEWARVAAILAGHELRLACGIAPQVRVRTRSWQRTDLRPAPRPQRAAAA